MADKLFELKIITPDRTFFVGDSTMVELNTTEGQVGIYADHAPTAMILSPGVAHIHDAEGNVKAAALHSGFIEIGKKSVMVLAEIAEWPDEIDINRFCFVNDFPMFESADSHHMKVRLMWQELSMHSRERLRE